MPDAPLRVLYVEDDRLGALLVTEMLRDQAGIALRCAEDGAEALTLAAQWPPQLLLLDAWLPDTSGHRLLQELRALPGLAAVPAIMCSADGSEDDRQRARDSGFAEFWAKPVQVEAVRQALRRWQALLIGNPAGSPGPGTDNGGR